MWNVLNKVAETYEDIKAKLDEKTPDGTLVNDPERLINVFLYIGVTKNFWERRFLRR